MPASSYRTLVLKCGLALQLLTKGSIITLSSSYAEVTLIVCFGSAPLEIGLARDANLWKRNSETIGEELWYVTGPWIFLSLEAPYQPLQGWWLHRNISNESYWLCNMRIQKRNLKLQYTILKRKWISQIVKKKSKTRLNIQLSQFMQTTFNEELISSFHLGITSSLRLNQAGLRAVWFYEKGSQCLCY